MCHKIPKFFFNLLIIIIYNNNSLIYLNIAFNIIEKIYVENFNFF